MKAVIFAGGVGSRLWPLSRTNNPKQFIGLIDHKTMIQLCYSRTRTLFKPEDIYVATGAGNVSNIHDQLPEIDSSRIFGEPVRRDLGPAVGMSAALIGKDHPNEPLAYVWGADQIYKNESKYTQLFRAAEEYLAEDPEKIIFFGDTPRFANQNIGWIEFGDITSYKGGFTFHQFKSFHAKPEREIATRYYRDNKHAWNIGDFVTTPVFFLSLFKKHAPKIYEKLMVLQDAYGTDSFQKVLDAVYPEMPDAHLDNAIFETMDNKNALVISANVGYADIGSWNTYKEAFENYPSETVTKGNARHYNTRDSLLFNTEDSQLIVGLDLDDIVVVNTKDVVFVARKSTMHNIKKVVKDLKESGLEDIT